MKFELAYITYTPFITKADLCLYDKQGLLSFLPSQSSQVVDLTILYMI